ncbi:dihydrolipoamide acetyltransferase [Streptococcus danieliae]|uniref:Dihydrolipoamide acetyltransferase n=1 Tax=Streptococcus danieliae TaxID=747656 RepID=A0A7X3G7F5_9STRE|nr:dihydrolipoamide acetyltransferase [Streptococcus danieliae]MBF0699217.1 dihydrolipoamide acetyltransferase [Streptococcus danieliae]MBF0717141.1 dihydrolipoamide acetyltransferase [Streptococcus danieliae]MCU0082609.1 dihydrolipoamide acetyltransferase [Streptococcus danieliae]MVX58400.1 dihydrolipoamide acetyltransferase [Streptococcus danieliae]NYS32639.1 dihydrolipoamide acetyltransferase [Streptococcus danieliae]
MSDEKLRATPAARKLADQLGINLYDVAGTGAKGRVHQEDVADHKNAHVVRISPLAKRIAMEHNIAWQEIQGRGVNGKIMKQDILALLPENLEEGTTKSPAVIEKVEEVPDTQTEWGTIERIPMTPMRKVIAQRMVDSYLTAPTFTLNYEVDMTEMLALRKKVLDPIMEETGKKVTVTDLISLAVIKTLMKHPYLNSSLTEDGQTIITHDYVNLAMAVGMDGGLLTPVVFNAEKLSLSQLVVAFKDVIGRALDMKLAPSELQNSTFTISNLGMFGVQSFGPIINQPNSAILGVSATIEKPVALNGEVVIRPMMSLGLTIDHRVVDGMAGAKFMKDLKALIENPISMLI